MSDLSRWPQADALLEQALDLPAGERRAFLDRQVRDPKLRAALAAVLAESSDGSLAEAGDGFLQPGGALQDPVFQNLEDDLEGGGLKDTSPALPRRIGAYRLTREIGRGGMARVFEAERVEGGFTQKVAVKLVRGTDRPDLYERFEQERQILASLHHRSIAHLYEGGKTESGEPYFVMELIDGESIESHCRRTTADLRTRIHLFLDVAGAVSFAHRNLVVHRDLKSSNVMVDKEGQVKLLDFGIARLVTPTARDTTATNRRMLTPEYASPEQLQGAPITTASDIYQLGHLLYRLLSERSPYHGRTTTPAYLQDAILTDTPTLPSLAMARPVEEGGADESGSREQSGAAPPGWAASLRGDLDAVVMKALRKEPERRYQTVQELADDLLAYLSGKPVRARPDSWAYRSRKFVSRHRAATGIAIIAVVALAGMAAAFTNRLTDERDRARASARRAEAVTGFLEQLFLDANPNISGRSDLSARELIERAPARIESELAGQQQVQSLLYGLTGRLIGDLGDETQSETWILRALDLADELGPEGAPARVVALRSLAGLRIDQHREDEAFELLDRADGEIGAGGIEAGEPGAVLEMARLIEARGRALISLGRYDEALEQYARAEQALAEGGASDEWFLLYVRGGFAKALRLSKRDPDRAIALMEANLADHRAFYGEAHPQLLRGMQELAAAYGSRAFDQRAEDPEAGDEDLERVNELLDEAFVISTAHFGEVHPNGARICFLQGAVAYADKDWDGVRSRYGKAVEIFESLPGYEDDAALSSMYLGVADLKTGLHEAAIRIFEQSLEAFGRTASKHHWRVASIYYYLGEAHYEQERYELARGFFEQAFTRFRESNGLDNPRTRNAQLCLADCHLHLAERNLANGKPREAAVFLGQARELYEAIPDKVDAERQALMDKVDQALSGESATSFGAAG